MREIDLEYEDYRPTMKTGEGLVVAEDFVQWWCPDSLDIHEGL